MFRFIKTFKKWDKHHKGVSPVIAAILLIGLAVLAGAAVFFIVLPLLAGSSDIAFSSITASDANQDGKVDTIKLSFTNSGTVAGEISEVDLSGMSGWSATNPSGGTADVNPGLTVEVTIRPGTVADQILTTDTIDVVVSVDGTPAFTIDENSQAEDGKTYSSTVTAKAISNADLEIDDYSDAAWSESENDVSVQLFFSVADANRQTASGSPGVQFRTDNGDPSSYFINTNQPDGTSFSASTNDPAETTTWNKGTNPVVSFYIKSDRVMGSGDLRVYFEAYSGNTDVGSFYYNIEPLFTGTYVANTWLLVTLDFSSTAGWSGYDADEVTATSVGGFSLYVDNNFADDWDLYIDDIYVSSGL
ncbi:MAG: hypothetical protein HeimC3_19360 [Candidatus Heimdallarchaeota archaeon LC_3]|nr:MAG: hypothetical protein HeimC3_19360 [Candidatus Heimdallarchaeota archaeon LC_3]